MCEIIHRIYAPFIACAVMRFMQYAVEHRVAHIEIPRRHVYFCPQHPRPVREFTILHAHEKIAILFNGALAVGALFPGFGESAAVFANFIRGQIVNVRFPNID